MSVTDKMLQILAMGISFPTCYIVIYNVNAQQRGKWCRCCVDQAPGVVDQV